VQLLKNFPAFYGTRRSITMFTRALHWSRSIQFMSSHSISLRSILILFTHLRLCLPSGLAVILRSESVGTHDHILLSQIRDSPNLEGQVPAFISPRNRVGPVIPPGTGFPFLRLLRPAGLRWKYSTPPPHGNPSISQEIPPFM
jgi:hypothetical protein